MDRMGAGCGQLTDMKMKYKRKQAESWGFAEHGERKILSIHTPHKDCRGTAGAPDSIRGKWWLRQYMQERWVSSLAWEDPREK